MSLLQTNTNNIRVSVFPELVRADMKVTQNDIDTNEVIVRVFDQSDVEIDYATITSALIIFTKPDYHVVQGDMIVQADHLYYKMGTNEIACTGEVKAQIQLIGSSGERLTIGGFSFTVQADPVTPWTVQSSSEYGILRSLIVEAQAAINDVDALSLWENYNPTKPYIPLNKVVYNGSCYINFVACQGVLPTDASKWLKIASRGEDGADGKDGADGTDGVDGADGIDATITIGTVTTGAAGTSASVNNVGTPSNAVFNFSIPKGDKGDPFTIDASDMLANISLYDYEPTGFSFLATDTGKIYFKNSNTSGDWSDPISFEGPAGPGVPQGGTTGQFLRKNSNADYETLWSDLPINNTLTSTSTTEALSAAQGKELNDALATYKTDLASQDTGKGASLVSIEDADEKFTATNVEGALAEVKTEVTAHMADNVTQLAAKMNKTDGTGAGHFKIVSDNNLSTDRATVELIGKRIDGNVASAFGGTLAIAKNRLNMAISAPLKLGGIKFGGNHTDASESNILYSASILGEAEGSFSAASTMPTALVFYTGSSGVVLNTGSEAGVERLRIDATGNTIAGADNTYNLGSAAKRWKEVFAGTGTINTSDRNDKEQIEDLNAAEKAVAVALKGLIKKFKFKDAVAVKGDNSRIHVGVIAQEVQDAFTAQGLDAHNYGIFCSDTWWEKDIEVPKLMLNPDYDDKVEGSQQYIESSEIETKTLILGAPEEGAVEKIRLGIRYDELLAFIIASL